MDKQRRKYIIILTIIPLVFVGIFIALTCLNLKSSITTEEARLAYITKGDASQVLSEGGGLYGLFLKLWAKIFGRSEVSLRFSSISLGAVSIILLFHFLKRWLSIKAVSIITLLFAIFPPFVLAAQKINHAPFIIFVIIVILYFIELVREIKFKKEVYEYRLPLLCIPFAIAMLIYSIVGLVNTNKPEENNIRETISTLYTYEERNLPAFVKVDDDDVYNFIFYSTDDQPISGVKTWLSDNDSTIKKYGINLVNEIELDSFLVIAKDEINPDSIMPETHEIVQLTRENNSFYVAEYGRKNH